jgi:pyruvate-ferredoxin/flavodoxin oxidoreductase
MHRLGSKLGDELVAGIATADQTTEAGIKTQRERVDVLKQKLLPIVDYLVDKSVWCIGGDGWAYDIGYGGLDHVIASGKNVNLLVLDTEVYSNTGGQASKSTPLGAVAQFAAGGKTMPKKDLGLMAMSYGNVYVACVSLSNPGQVVKAFLEAEAYDGPSLIIAYAHCIAHGINMTRGIDEQKKAVASGHWPLYRYNPTLAGAGKNPLQLDSKAPSISFDEYAYGENRYKTIKKSNPEVAERLMQQATKVAKSRYEYYRKLSELSYDTE